MPRRRRLYRASNPLAPSGGRVLCTLLDPFDDSVVWRGDVYDSHDYLWGGTYRGWTTDGQRIVVEITRETTRWRVGNALSEWTVWLNRR